MSSSSHEGVSTGSCNLAGAPQPACIEYANASSDQLELDAEPMCQNGTWELEACPRASALGGCESHVSGPYGSFTLTNWFYPGGALVTAADVRAKCDATSQTFVSP